MKKGIGWACCCSMLQRPTELKEREKYLYQIESNKPTNIKDSVVQEQLFVEQFCFCVLKLCVLRLYFHFEDLLLPATTAVLW